MLFSIICSLIGLSSLFFFVKNFQKEPGKEKTLMELTSIIGMVASMAGVLLLNGY